MVECVGETEVLGMEERSDEKWRQSRLRVSHRWLSASFQGLPRFSRPQLQLQFLQYLQLLSTHKPLLSSYNTRMPYNSTSDDVDYVVPDPKPSNAVRKPPPAPEPLPDYEPMPIKEPYRTGVHNLPSTVDINDPYAIFSLFFDHSILKTLARHTNKYASLHQPDPAKYPKHRPWKPTTWKELRAYIAAYIWMGLHKDLAVDEFWKENEWGTPIYPEVSNFIGRERWQQIDRFFHISDPEVGE